MISNKHITKIIAVIMVLAVCLCFCTVMYSDQITAAAGDSGVTLSYESKLFDTDEIIDINIIISEDDWNDMLTNATAKEYHTCDVEVNGTMFYQVAIRTKGNTSLTSIANDPDTDRYSFKLEFDHNIDEQTCFGLDKLVLNNNYADATNMKEALIYDMFQYLGADASLYNYAKLSVNGTYWGVYLALEAVEDSFMLRNYGVQNGELYKPDNLNFANNDKDDSKPDVSFDASSFPGRSDSDDSRPSFSFGSSSGNSGFGPSSGNSNQTQDTDAGASDQPSADFSPSSGGSNQANTNDKPSAPDNIATITDMSGFTPPSRDDAASSSFSFGGFGGGGGFGISSGNGTNLNYIDDDVDSYSAIWSSAISKISTKDKQRVVTALKNIADGTSLETYMDTDNILRYLAVHIFSVNEDSLSGSMAHNYYLYEYSGKLNIIPWDYNLALGGMSGGDASSVVNSAIDDAFSITNFFDSLLDDETYHSQYYAYLQELVDGYINGGAFDAFYHRVRNQIDELIETDPNAFFAYDEYTTAAEMLYKVVKLRGESISGQISGEIPSTDSAQRNSSVLIDASSIDLSVMGSMNTGNTPCVPEKDSFDTGNFHFNGAKSGAGAAETPDSTAAEDTATDAQPAVTSAPSDASASTDMPSMPGNADFGGSPGGSASSDSAASDAAASALPQMPGNPDFSASSGASAQSGIPPTNGGTAPEGFDASQSSGTPPSDVSASQHPDAAASPAGDAPSVTETPAASANGESFDEKPDNPSDKGSAEVGASGFARPSGDFSSFPGAFGSSGTSESNAAVISQNLVNYGICLAVMIVAIVIALLFRRRR